MVVWTLYKRAIKRCGILLISLAVVTVNFITRYSAHYVNLFSTAYTFKLCHYKYSDFNRINMVWSNVDSVVK